MMNNTKVIVDGYGDAIYPEGNDEQGIIKCDKFMGLTDDVWVGLNNTYYAIADASRKIDLFLNDLECDYSAEFGQSEQISKLYDEQEILLSVLKDLGKIRESY
jgi:hypothetical protein